MDTIIPDRYAGENQIETRPDVGHGAPVLWPFFRLY